MNHGTEFHRLHKTSNCLQTSKRVKNHIVLTEHPEISPRLHMKFSKELSNGRIISFSLELEINFPVLLFINNKVLYFPFIIEE